MWQEIIVGFCVVAAIAFITRRFWLTRATNCGTGSCGGCGTASACKTPDKTLL